MYTAHGGLQCGGPSFGHILSEVNNQQVCVMLQMSLNGMLLLFLLMKHCLHTLFRLLNVICDSVGHLWENEAHRHHTGGMSNWEVLKCF